MKTTQAKKIELKSAGICKIKSNNLTINGINLKTEETKDTLLIKGNGNNFITIGGTQTCIADKVINLAQNIVIINNGTKMIGNKVNLNDCEKEINTSTETKQYKLNNKLKELKISGSGEMIIDTDLLDDEVYICLKGSGDFEIKKLKSKDVYINLTGSGDIYVKEISAKNLKVELKGSGDINIKNAKADNLEVLLLGAGDISITGNFKNINKKIFGVGDLRIKTL